MPGHLMTAQQAKKQYAFKSIKNKGNSITLKNSTGKKVTVGKNTKVYHRGRGNFGIYSQAEDSKRYTRESRIKGDKIGKGRYRHTHT